MTKATNCFLPNVISTNEQDHHQHPALATSASQLPTRSHFHLRYTATSAEDMKTPHLCDAPFKVPGWIHTVERWGPKSNHLSLNDIFPNGCFEIFFFTLSVKTEIGIAILNTIDISSSLLSLIELLFRYMHQSPTNNEPSPTPSRVQSIKYNCRIQSKTQGIPELPDERPRILLVWLRNEEMKKLARSEWKKKNE